MAISKQLMLLQGATFCHLSFMQNLTEGLPPTEKAPMEGRLPASGRFSRWNLVYLVAHN